jgi:hypothetical protein
MLLRNIRAAGFDPQQTSFELFSVGPLFPEQPDLMLHRKHRDIVGPLETALAEHLKKAGHRVLGKHPKIRPYDAALFETVLLHLKGQL